MPSGTRYAVLAALVSLSAPALAEAPNPCTASVVDKQTEDEISAVVPTSDGGAFLVGTSGPSFDRTFARNLWVLRMTADGTPTQEKIIMTSPSQLVAGAAPMPQGGFVVALGRSTSGQPTSVEVMRFDATGEPIVGQSEVLENGGTWNTPRDLAVSLDGSRIAVVHSRASQSFDRSEACITFLDSSFPVTVKPDINGIATPAATTAMFCAKSSPKTDFRAVEALGGHRWGVLANVQEGSKVNFDRLHYVVVDEYAGIVTDTRLPSKLGREEAADLVRLSDGSLVAVSTAFSDYSSRGWVARVDGSGNVLASTFVGPVTPVGKTKNDGWSLGAAAATGDGGIVLAGTRWSRHSPGQATRGWVVRLDRSFREIMDSELAPTDDLAVTGVWLGSDGRVRLAGRNQKPRAADHDGWTAVLPYGSGDVCEVQLR